MNEVDKLYHEWKENQRKIAEDRRRYLREQNPRWYDEDGFDVNALIQAQFVEKLFADEK